MISKEEFELMATRFGGDFFSSSYIPNWSYEQFVTRLHLFVVGHRDDIKKWFKQTIFDDQYVKDYLKTNDEYWIGLLFLIREWIRVYEDVPFSDHPRFDSLGADLYFEVLGAVGQASDKTYQAIAQWLDYYFPNIDAFEGELLELYVDAILASTTPRSTEFALKTLAVLPPEAEFLKVRIKDQLSSYDTAQPEKVANLPWQV